MLWPFCRALKSSESSSLRRQGVTCMPTFHRLLTSRFGVEHARNQENLTPPSPDAALSVDQAAGDPCMRGSASGGLGVMVNVHPLEVPLHVPSRAYQRCALRGAELQHHTERWVFRFEQPIL